MMSSIGWSSMVTSLTGCSFSSFAATVEMSYLRTRSVTRSPSLEVTSP